MRQQLRKRRVVLQSRHKSTHHTRDEFKARNAELKRLKDANDAEEKQVEELVRAVGGAANAFAAEHAALATRVAALEQLEREAEAAELNAGEAASTLRRAVSLRVDAFWSAFLVGSLVTPLSIVGWGPALRMSPSVVSSSNPSRAAIDVTSLNLLVSAC